MRVKSRKPLAAWSKYAAASGRAASSATSVNASTCGRCETAAKIASWRSGASVPTRAPHACHIAVTRATASRSVSASGVEDDAAVCRTATGTPRRRRCARCRRSDGPGRTTRSFAPNASRAAAITSCLVLPASVTHVVPARDGARAAASSDGNCATGAATSTTSASASFARPRPVERDRAVDDAALERRVEIGPRAADADDFAHGAGALQRQRAASRR